VNRSTTPPIGRGIRRLNFNEAIKNYLPDFECLEYSNSYCVNNTRRTKTKELIFLKGDFNV